MTINNTLSIFTINTLIDEKYVDNKRVVTTKSSMRTESTSYDDLELARDFLEKKEDNPPDRTFWKRRLVAEVSVSSEIVAVVFLPKIGLSSKNQTITLLYVEKNMKDKPSGLLAPYFSKELKEKFNVLDKFQRCNYVKNETEISNSLNEIDETIAKQLFKCLSFFLKDFISDGIGLTFKKANETVTWGWLRA